MVHRFVIEAKPMNKSIIAFGILVSCLAILGVANAANTGIATVQASLTTSGTISAGSVTPSTWNLVLGSNSGTSGATSPVYVTTNAATWYIQAAAAHLTSTSKPADALSNALVDNGHSLSTTTATIYTGSGLNAGTTPINLALSQQVINTNVAHTDYKTTITYTLSY